MEAILKIIEDFIHYIITAAGIIILALSRVSYGLYRSLNTERKEHTDQKIVKIFEKIDSINERLTQKDIEIAKLKAEQTFISRTVCNGSYKKIFNHKAQKRES